MQIDRELLELAAKAVGLVTYGDYEDNMWAHREDEHPDQACRWNPMIDDGDALRLAVKLNLMIDIRDDGAHTYVLGDYGLNADELHGDDAGAATRRAIVRAAAEIAVRAHPDHKDGGAVYG